MSPLKLDTVREKIRRKPEIYGAAAFSYISLYTKILLEVHGVDLETRMSGIYTLAKKAKELGML